MSFLLFILSNLLRQKIRTGLTVLGIRIGITTVVALGVITHSARKTTEEIITAGGSEVRGVNGNLDSKAGQQVLGVLRDVRRQGAVTLILVSHDPAIAAAADRGSSTCWTAALKMRSR